MFNRRRLRRKGKYRRWSSFFRHPTFITLYFCLYCPEWISPQSTQSAGPVRFLKFCSVSIFLLVSLVVGRRPGEILVQSSRECTLSYLSTGISNLLQPAQAEVVLGQLSTYLASWDKPIWGRGGGGAHLLESRTPPLNY